LATRMSHRGFPQHLDANPIPVHDGARWKYLREIGQWTEEDRLPEHAAIEKMDAWIRRPSRNAGMKEARWNRGVNEMNFLRNRNTSTFLAKHTDRASSLSARVCNATGPTKRTEWYRCSALLKDIA